MASTVVPRRSGRRNKKQTQLAFSTLPSSSPAKQEYSPAVQSRLASVRYASKANSHREADSLPTPEPSSQPLAQPHSEHSEEDDDDLVLPGSKRRRVNTEPSTLSTPLRRSGRLDTSSAARPSSSSSSATVFSHVEVITPSRKQTRDHSSLGSPEATDDDGDVMVSQPARRRKAGPVKEDYREPTASRHGRTSGGIVDDFMVDDDQIEYITSDEEEPPQNEKQKAPRTARRRSVKEQEELDADLDDLQNSDAQESASKARTRGGPVTTKRDQAREHLELLKRRRAGERIPRVHDPDDDDGEPEGADINLIGRPTPATPAIVDDDSVHSSVDTDQEPEEEDEEDFIEQDTSGRLGRPHPDIPIEFTSLARARPQDLFPHVVEWLVKNKLAPAFARNDDVYRLALGKVKDQVLAQAGSRLISSAWNATFKWTILARPNLYISAMPGLDDDLIRTCDACNKTNRPARFDFVLSGEAYENDTLEAVDNSDDEDESDDEASRDEKGHVLAKQTQHFYLGSHCAANAQSGHKLTHWKYHLNEAVITYLEEQGVLSAEAIVAREKLKHKKREREAEAIIDSMEETGKMHELWKEFQADLDDARLGMEDYEKRGGRSRGRIGVIQSSAGGRLREWRDDKYKESTLLSDSD